MIPLFKNNYIRRSGNGPTFTVEFDPLPTDFDNYYIESCRAAEELYDIKEGKLNIFYSGGTDSEYALGVFLSLGIPVTPVILKLGPNYNDHDLKYALKFCQVQEIEPDIIDIDFDHFVKSGKLLDTTIKIKSSSFMRAATAYAAGQVDGTVIMGEGEPYIRKNVDTGTWNVHIDEHDYTAKNYFDIMGIVGTSHFNSYTPEMTMAYLHDTQVLDLVNNRVPGKLSSHSSKSIMYNRHSNFNLEARQKYHGYEKVVESKIIKHNSFKEIEKLREQWDGVYSKDYFEFMENTI